MSILTKNQSKNFSKTYTENGVLKRIYVVVRYDDQCGNGHNTFSITGDIYYKNRREPEVCGCIHKQISYWMPELAPYIKWHLCSSDGPLHYIPNTLYWLKEGNFNYARSSAIWPEATDAELKDSNIEQKLRDRLPGLMEEFKKAVSELGFVY